MLVARTIRVIAPLALLLGALLSAHAAETPLPPAPSQWVTDSAGFLSAGTRASLDKKLEAYEEANKHQVIVWIGKTTGGVPIEDWAVRAFEKWKVGRKGIDDGLVLFIFTEDRKLRIEVGYGLEGDMPDAMAARIINDVIVPRIRAGDRDGAVSAGVNAILDTLGGKPIEEQSGLTGNSDGPNIFEKIIIGITVLLLLAFFIHNPSLALWLLINIATSSGGGRSSGGFSGGGFSGGGFSGGGGRSGGGGASGSW